MKRMGSFLVLDYLSEIKPMNFLRSIHLGVLVAFLSVMTVSAGEEDFDADKMLSELETQRE